MKRNHRLTQPTPDQKPAPGRAPVSPILLPRGKTLGPGPGWLVGFAALLQVVAAQAWQGHSFEEWRKITTWQKPELTTHQVGQRELAPLLAPDAAHPKGILSVADWQARREETALAIRSILGQPTTLGHPACEVQEGAVERLPAYTRRHLLIRCERDEWIPAYLLVPHHLVAARVPAMICLHQTVTQGKDEPCGIEGDPGLAFADQLAKRGYICLAPDVIGFGERIAHGKQVYYNNVTFFHKHPAWSCMGKMVWDVSRLIDYLETLPYVDHKRIGCMGHSHGAYGTLFAAAFDRRISLSIASCGFTTFRRDPVPDRWSHLTPLIPQLGFYLPDVAAIPFDWQDVCALIAPRPLFVWYTTRDSIFPNTDNLETMFQDVKGVYGLFGKGDALGWQALDGPHTFPSAGREAAYRWMERQWAWRPAARPQEP